MKHRKQVEKANEKERTFASYFTGDYDAQRALKNGETPKLPRNTNRSHEQREMSDQRAQEL